MDAFNKLFSIFSRNTHLQQNNPYADFSVRRTIVEHNSFCDALRRVTTLHRRGLDAGVPGGLLITGQTGSGKTTLAEFYRAYFPRQDLEDRTVTPVLVVTTPESPSVKSLAEAVLIALGDPAAAKGTTEEKTRRIFRYLKECRVELLIIDEFQHFYDSGKKSQAMKVTDWLKNLFNIANIPVLLVGLPRSVMVVRMNPQLQRRFSSPFYLKPFRFDTAKERVEFRGVLKKIHGTLPLPCPELHEANLAHRFFMASCGLFDYLAKIIDRAVQIAGEEGHKELIQKHFARAFKEEVWRDVPDKLNPFNPKSILRPLTKLGEPFEIWDAPDQYVHKRAA
jgi:dephospho-CoA kinase